MQVGIYALCALNLVTMIEGEVKITEEYSS